MAEPLDRNKTALTHRVTATASAYLYALGCKPVETEVFIRRKWVADVASYWYPTHTEFKKLRLERLARHIIAPDISRANWKDWWPRVYGDGPFTVLVEVKTTRGDYTKDKRKWNTEAKPAHFCFLAYPKGMVEEVPKGWYGLETNPKGDRLRKLH